jgi:Tfp pilus assembly protein PilF
MPRAESRDRALAASAAVAAYATALLAHGWPRDDRWLILEHPLLRAGWPAAARLLTSGYVQPVLGARTPIHEWRPMLSLTFLLQRVTTGFAPLPLHAVNLALHVAAVLLVLEAFRRRLGARAALAGALVFAVLPVHAEVVAYLTSRSELLAALSVLGAWLLLTSPRRPDPRAVFGGAVIYLLGSLSKESAILFPAFLALSDWTFDGELPWSPARRRVYLALGAAAALVVLGRVAVLPSIAHGGVAYFAGTPPLSRILTLSRFWSWSYLRPAVLGVGLCTDFARPLVPDSGPGDLAAWAALLSIAAVVMAAARAVWTRREWGFWLLGPCLFLLPTSHLLMNLDTLGAQRFLYIPCLALAAGAGVLFARVEKTHASVARASLCVVVLLLGARASVRALDWRDDAAYYHAAVACNPVSAKARVGLGLAELRDGRTDSGEADLVVAQRLDPNLYDAAINLAKVAFDRGDDATAIQRTARALTLAPDAAEALVLAALLDERAGRSADAEAKLAHAAAANPDDPVVRFDYARALAKRGAGAEAALQVAAYLRLVPAGPDAAEARRWLDSLQRP